MIAARPRTYSSFRYSKANRNFNPNRRRVTEVQKFLDEGYGHQKTSSHNRQVEPAGFSADTTLDCQVLLFKGSVGCWPLASWWIYITSHLPFCINSVYGVLPWVPQHNVKRSGSKGATGWNSMPFSIQTVLFDYLNYTYVTNSMNLSSAQEINSFFNSNLLKNCQGLMTWDSHQPEKHKALPFSLCLERLRGCQEKKKRRGKKGPCGYSVLTEKNQSKNSGLDSSWGSGDSDISPIRAWGKPGSLPGQHRLKWTGVPSLCTGAWIFLWDWSTQSPAVPK